MKNSDRFREKAKLGNDTNFDFWYTKILNANDTSFGRTGLLCKSDYGTLGNLFLWRISYAKKSGGANDFRVYYSRYHGTRLCVL